MSQYDPTLCMVSYDRDPRQAREETIPKRSSRSHRRAGSAGPTTRHDRSEHKPREASGDYGYLSVREGIKVVTDDQQTTPHRISFSPRTNEADKARHHTSQLTQSLLTSPRYDIPNRAATHHHKRSYSDEFRLPVLRCGGAGETSLTVNAELLQDPKWNDYLNAWISGRKDGYRAYLNIARTMSLIDRGLIHYLPDFEHLPRIPCPRFWQHMHKEKPLEPEVVKPAKKKVVKKPEFWSWKQRTAPKIESLKPPVKKPALPEVDEEPSDYGSIQSGQTPNCIWKEPSPITTPPTLLRLSTPPQTASTMMWEEHSYLSDSAIDSWADRDPMSPLDPLDVDLNFFLTSEHIEVLEPVEWGCAEVKDPEHDIRLKETITHPGLEITVVPPLPLEDKPFGPDLVEDVDRVTIHTKIPEVKRPEIPKPPPPKEPTPPPKLPTPPPSPKRKKKPIVKKTRKKPVLKKPLTPVLEPEVPETVAPPSPPPKAETPRPPTPLKEPTPKPPPVSSMIKYKYREPVPPKKPIPPPPKEPTPEPPRAPTLDVVVMEPSPEPEPSLTPEPAEPQPETEPSPTPEKRPLPAPQKDLDFLAEMERERLAGERQMKAASMFNKIRRRVSFPKLRMDTIVPVQEFGWLPQFCIVKKEYKKMYKAIFETVDDDKDGYLNCFETLLALKGIVGLQKLTEKEEEYVYRVLEIADYNIAFGTDFKLFAVVAALAQKIASIDDWAKNLIKKFDLEMLDWKMFRAKEIFKWCLDEDSNQLSVKKLMIELKAGGVSQEHQDEVMDKFGSQGTIDLLTFMTYLPLFIMTHESVVDNPLNMSRDK